MVKKLKYMEDLLFGTVFEMLIMALQRDEGEKATMQYHSMHSAILLRSGHHYLWLNIFDLSHMLCQKLATYISGGKLDHDQGFSLSLTNWTFVALFNYYLTYMATLYYINWVLCLHIF